MNAKMIVTIALLIFVAAALAVAILGGRTPSTPPEETAFQPEATVPTATGEPAAQSCLYVYYFHGNVRCQTCMKLEAYGEEAVATAFADELRNGTVVWKVVNIDEAANEHFVREFQLANKTIVVSESPTGLEGPWEKLDEIWQLVGDKPAYLEFVQGKIRNHLKESET